MPTKSKPDPVETIIAEALDAAGISYIRGRVTGELDFLIDMTGDDPVWIECKRFYTERVTTQLSRHSNVILIQGLDAAKWFARHVADMARYLHHTKGNTMEPKNDQNDFHGSIQQSASFQEQVAGWVRRCFGEMSAADRYERTARFLEEALELVQAVGFTAGFKVEDVQQVVDYVYGREPGYPEQEVGGTLLTLAALCSAFNIDLQREGRVELLRVENPTVMAAIRAKNEAKIASGKLSPLPGGIKATTETSDWKPTHRHYKGGRYRVIGQGKNEADLKPMVIYDNAAGEIWVRPQEDFEGLVKDVTVSRFVAL